MATKSSTQAVRRSPAVQVDLALQGGGSHGAFAWGVLDRLIEEEGLAIEAISGTSAGAMNAAVFAHGMQAGGPDGARSALRLFWRRVSQAAAYSPFQRTPLDRLTGNWSLDHSPGYLMADVISRLVAPGSFGNLAVESNPLRRILEDTIDFPALATAPIKLFITATNVRTGRGRVFRSHEISADVLLASACLPTIYQPVEIDGEHYWDGGFAGNPTITPLVQECESRDTILVQVNPISRPDIPRSAREIINRTNEVSFNACLLKELKMIALLREVADPGNGAGRRWSEMRLHRVSKDLMRRLSASSKLNAEWAFLEMLHGEGRSAADTFLRDCGDRIGRSSTFDFESFVTDI
jgi:NTE family protein